MIGIILLCAKLACAKPLPSAPIQTSVDFNQLPNMVASVTSFISTKPLLTATTYSVEEQHLIDLVQAQFFIADKCWVQTKTPSPRTQRGMARGFVQGYRQFFPMRYDKMIEVFAYVLSETGGNSVDNGKEAGVCGLWIETGMEAAMFYSIPAPKSRDGFRRKLLDSPEWCAYMTVASLSMLAHQRAGDFTQGVAVMKLGCLGYLVQCEAEARKSPKAREGIERFPAMPNYISLVWWLRCVDQRLRFGLTDFCSECSSVSEKFNR